MKLTENFNKKTVIEIFGFTSQPQVRRKSNWIINHIHQNMYFDV